MVSADTIDTFARCRTLALASMIEAGGKPCWVACDPSPPPTGRVATLRGCKGAMSPVVPPPSPAAVFTPPPPPPPAGAAIPGAKGGKRPVDLSLSAREREMLCCFRPAALARIAAVLDRLDASSSSSSSPRLATIQGCKGVKRPVDCPVFVRSADAVATPWGGAPVR